MQKDIEFQVALIYARWRLQRDVGANDYKRLLLNHMSYSHAYLSGTNVELASANPVALCEAAMHAAACAWCLADYHNEASPPEPIPAQAWEGVANRWIKAVEKWSKQLKSNAAAAYAAPIRERAALKELPSVNGGQSRTKSTAPGRGTASTGAAISGATRSGDASPKHPITGSGVIDPTKSATLRNAQEPYPTKRSHKKKPVQGGS